MGATGEFAVPAGCGYFPPLLLVESMAQLGGIAAGQHQGEGGVLAALVRVGLPAVVEPGSSFSVCSRIVKAFGRLVLIEGEVREDGKVIACATLTLAIGPAN
ncbi:MAG TPA: hydroxymyristoyl-ACP dehydratase [Geomonas sp.]